MKRTLVGKLLGLADSRILIKGIENAIVQNTTAKNVSVISVQRPHIFILPWEMRQ